jgi:hypothetical protein
VEWSEVKDGLRALIPLLIAVQPVDVCWTGDLAERSYVTTTRVVLTANVMRAVGEDETRSESIGDDLPLEVTNVGQRAWTLSIKIETENGLDIPNARALLDKLIIRFKKWELSVDALSALGIAYGRELGRRYEDSLGAGRGISYATCDLAMLGTQVDEDDSVDESGIAAGNWIERVTGTGTFTDPSVSETWDSDKAKG